jgi:hypothetical protein
VAPAAGRQEAAHVAQRSDERRRDRDRLPHQIAEWDREPERVQAARDREPGVQERAVAGRQVEAVADQQVMRGLADPGEVLELVGRQQPVRAAQRPALDRQHRQHEHRQAAQHDERAELDPVEPEPGRQGIDPPRAGWGGRRRHGRQR